MKKRTKSLITIIGIIVAALVAYYFFFDNSYSDHDYSYGYDDYHDYDDDYHHNDFNHNYDYNSKNNTETDNGIFSPLGSAGELKGTTLIVSIFADDTKTTWANAKKETKNNTLEYVRIAQDWIITNAKKYGSDASFTFDWKENPDLYYTGKINTDLTKDGMDYATWNFILENVDYATLKSKYNADNIIFMVLVNTPKSNSITSCTTNWYEGIKFPFEICYMYVNLDGSVEPPSAYAHEILHTFGAPDLYMDDPYGDNYGITKKYVKWCKDNKSNDIMYTCYDNKTGKPYYNRISNDFTELDAYYVGLTKKSSEVEEWGFKKSQH